MKPGKSPHPAQGKHPLDPLYVIFEKHLLNFQDADLDRKTFISHVIRDYFSYLRKMKIVVPISLEKAIAEELMVQVQTMLVKKIYGFHSLQEFQKSTPQAMRLHSRQKYTKLLKTK